MYKCGCAWEKGLFLVGQKKYVVNTILNYPGGIQVTRYTNYTLFKSQVIHVMLVTSYTS